METRKQWLEPQQGQIMLKASNEEWVGKEPTSNINYSSLSSWKKTNKKARDSHFEGTEQ